MAAHRYSCLEDPLDKGARRAKIHRATKELDTTEHLNSYFLQPSASPGELHWPSKPWRKRRYLELSCLWAAHPGVWVLTTLHLHPSYTRFIVVPSSVLEALFS